MSKPSQQEVISNLRTKNQELQTKVNEQTQIIEGYKAGDMGAQAKMNALNEMHAQKIKNLLKSINNLKKDIQKEKLMHQDNVRVKMIEKQKKELGDQDIIIDALRDTIGNSDQCDRAIIDALNKGPKRFRVQSREELKMEITKLKNQLLKAKKGGEGGAGGNGADRGDPTLDPDRNLQDKENTMAHDAGETGLTAIELEEINHKLIIDLNAKNQKILELYEQLDEFKVYIYIYILCV